MSQQTFEKIVERIAEFEENPNIIHLFGLGEPLVNPLIAEFAKIIKDKKLSKELAITTNGSLLSKNLSQELIESKIDRITISLNGLKSADYFDNCGVEVDYEELYEQIKYLCSIRESTHVHIKIIGNYYSDIEKERFIHEYENICDTFNIDYLNNSWPGYDIADNKSVDMYSGAELSKGLVCPHVFYEMMINSDGSVSPCSLDYTYVHENLRNVYDNSLVDIWNGHCLNMIREETLLGEKIKSYSLCKECVYPTSCVSVDITPYRKMLLHKLWPEKYL